MSLGQRFLVVFLFVFQLISGLEETGFNESSEVNKKLVSNGTDQDVQIKPSLFDWSHRRLEISGVNVNGSYKVNGSLAKESDNDAHANDTSPNLSWKQIVGRLESLNASSSVKEKPWNWALRGVRSPIPEYFDWRDHKGVSPVKDQGQCDACWAFSAVANIESQLWIRGHPLILSEQFLIDCNTMDAGCSKTGVVKTFAHGPTCFGLIWSPLSGTGIPVLSVESRGNSPWLRCDPRTGFYSLAVLDKFTDIVSNIGGVIQNLDYPPYIQQKAKCRWNRDSSLLVPVVGLERAQPLNEAQMAQLVYTYGPLSAAINDAMMVDPNRDPKGIDQPTESQCPSGQEHLNHAVLIVGYNVYKGNDGSEILYWIIKNSWGEAWGDRGYYYLQRGINACGIARDVSFAKIPSF